MVAIESTIFISGVSPSNLLNDNGVLSSLFINYGVSGTICFISSIDGGGEHNVINKIDDKIISTIFEALIVLIL